MGKGTPGRGSAQTKARRAGQGARRHALPRKAAARPAAARDGDPQPSAVRKPFPIVGIGASAGGLEALELFLRNVRADTGMAYVVVQHLDPNHKGNLVELLQRASALPVLQVKDRMRVAPDHVYVIPPNRDLSVLHGVLHLMQHTTVRTLPIDFFLRSLAEDR
jgi:two-component system, chemotaxis family, CheB/CheR fusion protein